MLPKIAELTSRKHGCIVSLKYLPIPYVSCQVDRPYFKHMPVKGYGETDEQAINEALLLLDEVRKLEAKKPIWSPDLKKQPLEGGYYREQHFEDTWIEYQNIGTKFAITRIYQQDQFGFTIVKQPFDLTNSCVKADDMQVKQYFGTDDFDKVSECLKDGEELFIWSTLLGLAGSAGYHVVKDGKVVRTKGVLIS